MIGRYKDWSDRNHFEGLKDSIHKQESLAKQTRSSNVVVATIIWVYIILLSQDVRSLMCDRVSFSQVELKLIPLLTKSFGAHFRNFLGTHTVL